MNQLSPEERFFVRVVVDAVSLCWWWQGKPDAYGYGTLRVGGRKTCKAHRWSYEFHLGPIPAGLIPDHLCHTNDPTCLGGVGCRHRLCVNPWHLELVTPRVNTLRGRSPNVIAASANQCTRGHPLVGANLYLHPGSGERVCRTCKRRWDRESARRRVPALAEVGA